MNVHVPGPALLDLGVIQLQQVIDPCQQFLSSNKGVEIQSVRQSPFLFCSSGLSYLDSPIVGKPGEGFLFSFSRQKTEFANRHKIMNPR